MSICIKRKKTCWKIHYSPCSFREDTAPKQLTNHNACNLSLRVVACAGARIYRTGTKFMRIIYLQVHIWDVWPLGMTDICVKIYRCHLLYARKYWFALLLLLLLLLLWHICISDVTSSLVWPLPGTIPQFRDNWFKTQGYFTIKHNETNILSSTVYLKTNKNINTTRIQILHRVYVSHYLN